MRTASVYRALVQAPIAAIVLVIAIGAVASDIERDATDTPPHSPATATLITQLGDRITGRWLADENPETIGWQAQGFVEPFQFDQDDLDEIQVRHTSRVLPTKGTYRCELADGDVLYGTPVTLDEAELVFAVPNTGEIRIDRRYLRNLTPLHRTDETVVTTPTALAGWQGDPDYWQEAAGRITAKQDNAQLTTELDLGKMSHISITLAWKEMPDFRIDFGANAKWDRSLRLETWQDQLILVAESPTAADVLLVKTLEHQAGDLTLSIFVDTNQKTIFVASNKGQILGQLTWQEKFQTKFRVHARKKGLRFHSATVTPWDGVLPVPHDADRSSVRYQDGKTVQATVTSWNADSQEWTFTENDDASKNESKSRKISSDQLGALTFDGVVEKNLGSVQAVSRNGMSFRGELVKLSDQAVWLGCMGIKDPIALPLSNLRSLIFSSRVDFENMVSENMVHPKKIKLGKPVRLLMSDTSIVGKLIDGRSADRASALIWKPDASQNASAIANHASGTIIYRPKLPASSKQASNKPTRRTGFLGGIARLFSKPQPLTPHKSRRSPTLLLRSGDSIPCEVHRIDSEGVTFSSEATEATFAPHAEIKALELVDEYQPARVTKEQRDRLLTLPRVQQEYPPTHLLLSVNGDLLRTRLISMDDKSVTSEVRLSRQTIPRDRIGAIAWLHQDEPEGGDTEEATDDSDPAFRVQAVQADGIRLTLHPQRFTDGVLLGKSKVFGNCRIEVAQIDQLLFGRAIDDAIKKQSHQLLTLTPAIAPRFVTAGVAASMDAGQDSALVGMEAPPVRLKTIKGSQYDLADHRGKVVILDFWATWCGPCIQWMPRLEQIVVKYSDQEVELVTINLLQDKATIEPTLERMQLSPTVLLDIDGVVADAYQATSIPQTVIIDQQGKINRVFIGGSSQIEQPLVEALDALTTKQDAQ